jgi:DNA-binding winged helix-turn-helix (wHTH) protein/predicted ATPase
VRLRWIEARRDERQEPAERGEMRNGAGHEVLDAAGEGASPGRDAEVDDERAVRREVGRGVGTEALACHTRQGIEPSRAAVRAKIERFSGDFEGTEVPMRPPRTGDAAPIRIELDTGWAWRGNQRLDLSPKAFAVLRHLVEHPRLLITKDELLAAAWEDVVVSDAAITSCIRDLRKALDDSSRAPRYIETVHRRGFRFIGPIASPSGSPAADARPAARPGFVGRTAELGRLHALLAAAAAGERRIVLVTGEAGIGKTTLVEAFVGGLGGVPGLRIARGQCVEQYGATEAYLPVLEALGRLGRAPAGEALVAVLKRCAPTWLVQLPSLLDDAELEAVQRRAQGATRERMLREMGDALDALAADAPFLLVLEDLHWGDAATMDLLALLVRRSDPARLLVVATYRPGDVTGTHPLRPLAQELRTSSRCEELALQFLDAAAIGEYLAERLPGAAFLPELAELLRQSTGGNPLFFVNVLDDLIAQGRLRLRDDAWELTGPLARLADAVPDTLAQLVEKQVERLDAREQAMLAVGSVAGAEFSSALATVDGIDADDGERLCAALARRARFLRVAGVVDWPDGTVAGRYAFVHAVHRNALYARIPIGHRVGVHLRIGARLEQAYGPRASEIAGELAMHFEHGRDFARGVAYRCQAANGALRQHGYREAVQHATRAIDLLATLPASHDRDRDELAAQTVLGAALVATLGWAAPEVVVAYARARELCAAIGVTPQLFPVLIGLNGFHLMRGEIPVAQQTTAQLLELARATDDAAMLLGAHSSAGQVAFYRGEFAAAVGHVDQALAIYDPGSHSPHRMFSVDHDPGVASMSHGAWSLQMLGHPDQALARMRACLVHARAIDHPLSIVMAHNFAATFHQFRREREAVRELEAVCRAYATRYDFDVFLLIAQIYRAWLVAEDGDREEGLALLRGGLAAFQAIGSELGRPTFLGIAATIAADLGRRDEALETVAEALALSERTGLRYWDAELHRLRGTFLAVVDAAAADASFSEALTIARAQQARALELRAAMSRARLWSGRRRDAEARALLADVVGWFREGFETADLVDATTLLPGAVTRRKRR